MKFSADSDEDVRPSTPSINVAAAANNDFKIVENGSKFYDFLKICFKYVLF